jgi:hypothetical protein
MFVHSLPWFLLSPVGLLSLDNAPVGWRLFIQEFLLLATMGLLLQLDSAINGSLWGYVVSHSDMRWLGRITQHLPVGYNNDKFLSTRD